LEGLAMDDVGKYYGPLVYFFPFWYLAPRKIWQPWPTLHRHEKPFKKLAVGKR
jgi:hypothetical protein